jgi:pimeloyl-ACP methyl ester carboxylesterase
MGWSMGVTIAAELALRHPERVAGLLLVAGAPGDSFDAMLPLVPKNVRRLVGLTSAKLLQQAGPVLDDAGIERCVVMGWSMGVTIAAELALRHPERVAGLLLVAGAPGDSFDAMLPVLPKNVRRFVGLTGTRLLQQAGPVLDKVLHRVPVTDLTTFLLRHSGVIKPSSDPKAVTQAVGRFLQHDWRWYFTLALALGETRRQDLSPIVCPVTLLAGRDDVLATTESMAGPVGALPQARLRVLPCSHYLPLEAPEIVSAELDLLLDRVRSVDFATAEAFTEGSRSRT